MLPSLLRRALILTGKRHLVPFLDGLTYLGRPSQVPFPSELMEQGLAIVLSGLNNTLAIQSNPDWVWPHWVERQISPEGEEFIPTAFNLIKSNLTCRNWTSVGLEDSSREAMIDPVGMLTLRPYGWSVFPYVRLDGRNWFPPRMREGISQELMDGVLPIVLTHYRVHASLKWESQAMAVRLQGEETLAFTHTLANQGNRHLSLRFGLALRPYNPLMLGHINRIHYHDGLWRINGLDGLLLDEEPDRVVVSDRHHGDPLVRDVLVEGLKNLRSKSGIACGLCEWPVELPVGAERHFTSAALLGDKPEKPSALRKSRLASCLGPAREAALIRLKEVQEEGFCLRLPDEKLNRAFGAIKGHLHVFDDGNHFSPGTFLYHQPWFRDSAFIAAAFDHLGWFARVENKVGPMLARQDRHGFFRSQNGEWDSNGQAMWTLVQHVRRGGSPDILPRIHGPLMQGARWIARMRRKEGHTPSPHYGLLPSGFSAEHFGPNDHYYWDNFWSIAGLESALWSANASGLGQDIVWLQSEIEEYRSDLHASLEFSMRRQENMALPCSPYRALDTAAIGNLVSVSPLGILPADSAWVKNTCEWLLKNNLRHGLFFQKIVHTGLNPYLSVQLARVLIALRDPRGHSILQALMNLATPTWTWPEAMHPRTFGGCMGDGDHGWSAAETLQLIRSLVIEDHGGRLDLLAGAPAAWFQPGLDIEIKNAPTVHGVVQLKIHWSVVSCVIEWKVDRAAYQDAAPVILHLPKALPLGLPPEARSDGGHMKLELKEKTGRLVLSPLTQDATLMERMHDAVRYQEQIN